MRLQFFGDRQDLFKWNALRTELREQDYHLVYIPMFTDLRGPHRAGNADDPFFNGIGNLRNDVERFLHDRLSGLFREKFHQRTTLVASGYRKTDQELYFRAVRTLIRETKQEHPGLPMLVFLDPDTGIGPESGGDDGHLMKDGLRMTLQALDARDRVLIYQHRQRVANNAADFEIRTRQLTRMLEFWGEPRTPSVVDLDTRANSYLIRL